MKIVLLIVLSVAVIVVGNTVLRVPQAAIELAAEDIGLGRVTNALLTSFILSAVIVLVAFFVGRNLKLRPGGLQNVIEALIEALDNLVNQTATRTWAPRFFPICSTIFIFLLVSNWFGILSPALGSIGIIHASDHGALAADDILFLRGSPEQVLADHAAHGGDADQGVQEAHFTIVPLLRAPSSDLNLTLTPGSDHHVPGAGIRLLEPGGGLYRAVPALQEPADQGLRHGVGRYLRRLDRGGSANSPRSSRSRSACSATSSREK